MEEVEQDGKGQRQTRSGERGGEQRREQERMVTEAGAEWAGRVPSPKGRDHTEMAKSTFQRVSCFRNFFQHFLQSQHAFSYQASSLSFEELRATFRHLAFWNVAIVS